MTVLSNYETQKCFQRRDDIFWTHVVFLVRDEAVCLIVTNRICPRSVLSACREIAALSEKLV